MNTTLAFKIDDAKYRSCSLVFRENITRDIYVYTDELEMIKGFEFWPKTVIEIERPSSVSDWHQFVYRVNLDITK